MDQGSCGHGPGVGDPTSSRECPAAPVHAAASAHDVGRMPPPRSAGGHASGEAPPAGHLGALAAASRSRTDQAGGEAPRGTTQILLRACEVARTLNSTPLGPVLDERQLYRHRMRAGTRIGVGTRIDFLAYIAWLVSVRHGHQGGDTSGAIDMGVISVIKLRALLLRQQYRCALTGRQLLPHTAALDHILPASRGGEHKAGNMQFLDRSVNRAKHTLTNEEFVALCREVVQWADAKTAAHAGAGEEGVL